MTATKKCEGWCEWCDAPATNIVEIYDAGTKHLIPWCDVHYRQFILDTVPKHLDGTKVH